MSDADHLRPRRSGLSIRLWLSSIVGVLVWCPLALTLPMSDVGALVSAIVLLPALPLFALALILLPSVAWRAVVAYRLPKMEAWWWLSAPFSVLFGLCSLLLKWDRFAHTLMLFILVYVAMAASTILWTVVELYRVVSARQLTVWKGVMLAVALMLPLIMWMNELSFRSSELVN
jgi:hypothetical protein